MNDKRISLKQIKSIINTLMELPYKNVAISIQILTNLEDIKTNNNTKDTNNKESK